MSLVVPGEVERLTVVQLPSEVHVDNIAVFYQLTFTCGGNVELQRIFLLTESFRSINRDILILFQIEASIDKELVQAPFIIRMFWIVFPRANEFSCVGLECRFGIFDLGVVVSLVTVGPLPVLDSRTVVALSPVEEI